MKITAAQTTAAATTAEPPKQSAALHHVAVEFETVLMKQLLSSAHALGKQKGGYADMALDALAGGIANAGGIGLAQAIEKTMDATSRLKVSR